MGCSGRCQAPEVAPGSFGPPVAKSTDGKLWFHSGEGIQVVDPRHVPFNKLPPPVHIEQIVADSKIYWQNLPDGTNLRLPARSTRCGRLITRR